MTLFKKAKQARKKKEKGNLKFQKQKEREERSKGKVPKKTGYKHHPLSVFNLSNLEVWGKPSWEN